MHDRNKSKSQMIDKESRIVTLRDRYLIITKVTRALCVYIPSEE